MLQKFVLPELGKKIRVRKESEKKKGKKKRGSMVGVFFCVCWVFFSGFLFVFSFKNITVVV